MEKIELRKYSVNKKRTSTMLKRLKNKIKSIIVRQIDQLIEKKLQLAIQMNDFINAPSDKLSSYVESKTDISGIVEKFKSIGIRVVEECINVERFKN